MGVMGWWWGGGGGGGYLRFFVDCRNMVFQQSDVYKLDLYR